MAWPGVVVVDVVALSECFVFLFLSPTHHPHNPHAHTHEHTGSSPRRAFGPSTPSSSRTTTPTPPSVRMCVRASRLNHSHTCRTRGFWLGVVVCGCDFFDQSIRCPYFFFVCFFMGKTGLDDLRDLQRKKVRKFCVDADLRFCMHIIVCFKQKSVRV